MTLYELTDQYRELVDLAENADDESDVQAFADTLEALAGEIDEKIENCAAVVRSIEAQAKSIREEEVRLAARRRAIENSTERLKRYMQDGMDAAGKSKIKGKLFTVSIQDNPPRVAVDDESQIPKDYMRVKYELDRTSISEAIKCGREVPGAHMEYGRGLRIR